MFKPNHWNQLVKGSQPLTSNGSHISGRKITNAKIKSTKKLQRDKDRAIYIQLFNEQLRRTLIESANELQILWERSAISKEVAELTRKLFSAAYATINNSLRCNARGATRALWNAKKLQNAMQIFRTEIDSKLTHERPHPLELACCLHEFCCDINHYETQIRYTYGLIYVTAEGEPKLSNRPTNWIAKIEFDKIITEHQKIYGQGSLPRTRQIKAKLHLANCNVSERTLREWRKQGKSGTFSRHIQPSKRQ